jgi:hypothetical protein
LSALGKVRGIDPRVLASAILRSVADGEALPVECARQLARAVLAQPAVALALRVLECDEREVMTRVVALAAEVLSISLDRGLHLTGPACRNSLDSVANPAEPRDAR